ncbi:MAG: ParB N-terminal domain-containing protein [Planctomycetes bacterium]|nr:ParB N-terminal domain-containing protein [Planctomycetota bacterium]
MLPVKETSKTDTKSLSKLGSKEFRDYIASTKPTSEDTTFVLPVAMLRDPALLKDVSVTQAIGRRVRGEPSPDIPFEGKVQAKKDIDSLKDSIKKEGLSKAVSIDIREGGKIVIFDGTHRLLALEELGIKTVRVEIVPRVLSNPSGLHQAIKNYEAKTSPLADKQAPPSEEFAKPSVQQVQNEKFVRASGKMLVPLTKENMHALIQSPGKLADMLAKSSIGPSTERLIGLAPPTSQSAKSIAQSFHDIADHAAMREGFWLNEFLEGMEFNGKRLPKSKHKEFRLHVRGIKQSTDPHVIQAVENTWILGEQIRTVIEPLGIPVYTWDGETTFKGRRRYFPIMLTKETIKEINQRKGRLYDVAVDHVYDKLQKNNLQYLGGGKVVPREKKMSDEAVRESAVRWLSDMREVDPTYFELNKLIGGLTGQTILTKAGGRFYGSAQRHRLFDWPDELTPENPYQIYEHHIGRMARLAAEAEYWGLHSATEGKATKLTGMLEEWIKEADADIKAFELAAGRDPKIKQLAFAKLTSDLIGLESNIVELQRSIDPRLKTTLRTARTVASGTFLFGIEAPVRNFIWGTASATGRFGPLAVSRTWAEFVFRGPTMIREARRAGALSHPYMDVLFSESAIPESVTKILRAPMAAAEVLLRSSSALLGARAWGNQIMGDHRRLTKSKDRQKVLLRKGKIQVISGRPSQTAITKPITVTASDISPILMRALTHREVGFREAQVVEMVRRGGLTEHEIRKMMRGAVNLTQFQAGARNIPIWMATEKGRFWFQFWGMAYQQTLKGIGYLMDEAGHGNFRPMFTVLMGMAFAAVSIKTMRDFLSGKTPSKRDLDILEQAIRGLGDSMGIVSKPVTLFTATRREEVIRQVTPPAISLVVDGFIKSVNAVRSVLPQEGFEAEKTEKLIKAWRRLVSTQSVLRSIDKLFSQFEQGRGPFQTKLKIGFSMDKVAEYYRGELANEYRQMKDAKAIAKVDAFAKEKISIGKEKKTVLGLVRGEFYDRIHFANKRGDEKESLKLRKYYFKHLAFGLDNAVNTLNKALLTRRFKETGEEPPTPIPFKSFGRQRKTRKTQ